MKSIDEAKALEQRVLDLQSSKQNIEPACNALISTLVDSANHETISLVVEQIKEVMDTLKQNLALELDGLIDGAQMDASWSCPWCGERVLWSEFEDKCTVCEWIPNPSPDLVRKHEREMKNVADFILKTAQEQRDSHPPQSEEWRAYDNYIRAQDRLVS